MRCRFWRAPSVFYIGSARVTAVVVLRSGRDILSRDNTLYGRLAHF
jgi:hypothetical protein